MKTEKSPSERFQSLLDSGAIVHSEDQASTVAHLERIYQELNSRRGTLNWPWKKSSQLVKGIYLWGEVGVGKSFLLELLFQSVSLPKLRQHYHVFMQEIQKRLFALQGTKNPLKKIAQEYAKNYRIFFLDEFIVNDITNAMVLAGLLEALFNEGICLITTSNIHPDNLYQYGFQREKFLPAIAHIKKNTEIIQQKSVVDYRRGSQNQHKYYFCPASSSSHEALDHLFIELTQSKKISKESWVICSRQIPVVKASDRIAWFDFHVLCEPPRSQLDYIAISKKIDRLFLSGVPVFLKHDTDRVSLFTKLIDVLYDEGIKLVITAEAPVDELYPEGKLQFAFERTRSRIIEMCS